MKAIVKTLSNYRNLNGRELNVIEIIGTRVSCKVFCEEMRKDITIDFCLNEVAEFRTSEDSWLIKRRNKAKRILTGRYRKGVNYLRLMDIIKECRNQLFKNSINRVFTYPKN